MLLGELLFPPNSPPARGVSSPHDQNWWRAVCILLVFPLAAAAHNAVFYYPSCMLAPFVKPYQGDYTLDIVAAWLSRDPSLPWAMATAMAAYYIGRNSNVEFKLIIASVAVAFLPLAVWIWDIPFTGRIVCHAAHDQRLQIFGTAVMSRHFYAIGLIGTIVLSWISILRARKSGQR